MSRAGRFKILVDRMPGLVALKGVAFSNPQRMEIEGWVVEEGEKILVVERINVALIGDF